MINMVDPRDRMVAPVQTIGRTRGPTFFLLWLASNNPTSLPARG